MKRSEWNKGKAARANTEEGHINCPHCGHHFKWAEPYPKADGTISLRPFRFKCTSNKCRRAIKLGDLAWFIDDIKFVPKDEDETEQLRIG